MIVGARVRAERRIPARAFDEHYVEKYRRPVRKALFFAAAEGPVTALRKARSKRAERRIERAQELVVARLELPGGDLLGLTRDLGGELAFEEALLFRASDGLPEPERLSLAGAALPLFEAYLPVSACPLASDLRAAVLAANPWLAPADGVPPTGVQGLRGRAATAVRPAPPRSAPGGVYLLGCGGYVREVVLPCFGRQVAAAVDHKAALIRAHAATGFPVHEQLEPLLDALSRDARPLAIVAGYHSDHVSLARAVLEANPAACVFVEKPPAVTVSDAAWLAERRAAGAWVDVGYNRRHAPLTSVLRAALADATHPYLLSMQVRELHIPESHWYNWPNQGTRITGNLCHWLDLATHLVNRPAVSLALVRGEGGASATITFDDGSLAAFVLTDRGDDLRGVTERIDGFAGSTTVTLDDFRRLTVTVNGRHRRFGGWRRDKGHAAMYGGLREAWLKGDSPRYPREDLVPVAVLIEAAAALWEQGGGVRRLQAGAAPLTATRSRQAQ